MAARKVSTENTGIGWIGTGVMGASMCMHLVKAGYRTTVYTRTRNKAEGLIEAGAAWAKSPKDAASKSDVLFTIVGFPHDRGRSISVTMEYSMGCGRGAYSWI